METKIETVEKGTYRVELAKSDRSTCTHCSDKIEHGSVRFGSLMKNFGSYSWRHLACVTERQIKNIDQYLGSEVLPPDHSTHSERGCLKVREYGSDVAGDSH